MYIFPAIDIIDGGVVRLTKGDYNAVKRYGSDCAATAAEFKRQGASHLHIVDLDGAKTGKAVNAEAIARIISATDMFTEVGGGIRTQEQVERYLSAGASRVILGTAAVRDPIFTKSMLGMYGEKISVGVDAANGKVAVSGWLEATELDSMEFCIRMRDMGATHVIYTDISRDGTLGGCNISAYERLTEIDGLKITASGGITEISEIRRLKGLGLYGAILGKALYEKKIDLGLAVADAEGE